jgi:hypothetical protein
MPSPIGAAPQWSAREGRRFNAFEAGAGRTNVSPVGLFCTTIVNRSRRMQKRTPSARRKIVCKCVTLHAYPAYVTADSWDVMIHVCHCGREHINESLIPPEVPQRGSARRRTRRR